uniref:C2H2-type domain-containing protein n=1 Tax=Erpetoichthys calabaricus TaxID=27687 RepID=A0A8C4T8X5_ERPCA
MGQEQQSPAQKLYPSSHVIGNAPQTTAYQLEQLIKHILTRFALCCGPNPAVSHVDCSFALHGYLGFFWKNVIDETVPLKLRNMAVGFVCQHWDNFGNVMSVVVSHRGIVIQPAQQYVDYMNTSGVYGATISIYFQERLHASPRVYNPAQRLSISLLFSGPLDHGHYEGAHPLACHTNVTSPAHSPLPEKHLKTHSPEHTHSTQDFQCTFCSKSFRVQRYLNAHLKKHNTNRMMHCEMDLHNHIQIHSKQRFVCKICDKHFHACKYLTNHLRTHSLMNSFQRQHCSKTFTRQKSLKAHLNTHSTEQMHSKQIFQCTICSKTFRVQRYLNMHLKTHSTERIMQWEHCQQCFDTTHSNSLQCQHSTKSFMHKHRIQFACRAIQGTYGCCHCESTSP